MCWKAENALGGPHWKAMELKSIPQCSLQFHAACALFKAQGVDIDAWRLRTAVVGLIRCA